MTREEVLALDAADSLAFARERFALPDGTIYLDGNSLGALPAGTPGHVARVVEEQWGRDLIASWNRHDWIGLPQRVGARIAGLVGAGEDEVIACDSTSVNLFKLLSAALPLRADSSDLVIEDAGFPTDRYIAAEVAARAGRSLRAVPRADLASAIDERTALVLLTHVDYRGGGIADIAAITAAAHAAGALVLWDLSHSAGAVAVDLARARADMAVGCGYKYLNGGPGAPAWLYVRRELQDALATPIPGWLGHAAPFAFTQDYRPAPGLSRMLCGTPPVLAMAALEHGLMQFEGVPLPALFAKGRALGDLAIWLVEDRCAGHGFILASPRDGASRGSHVAFAHPHAHALCQALIARGVVGDFRAPDILRLGFAPLYLRLVEVWDAVEILGQILDSGEWDQPRFHQRDRVT
ncbi:kynureninase [Croceicoccus sp. BE223]|uniref:kynureninase n=1 Tax=Croceicoccus sp. BE223 TaxID=2817716 RepID=UPI00285F3822|nr:kynureninase [Croceicoccus sp. BE223]MDR7101355.1 kynureninase [Croceicoccus sp. BE223]